jgi:tetratricopeptide (TPR) repeat protein
MRRVGGAGNEQAIARCEALVQFARGQYGPALRGLERIVAAPDADTLSMIVAIESAVRREEFGVAQQLSSRAAARFPQNPRVVEGALRVSQATGRRDEALGLAERLLSIEPDNALAKSILAAAQDPARMAPAQDELEAQLRKAFQDSKGDPRALRDAAVALMTAHPQDVRPRLMWVEAIARTGDREAALKATDESLAVFPDNEVLKARKLDLSTTDPVERLRLVAAQRQGTDAERLMYEVSTLLASEPAFERASLSGADQAERERITKELASIRKAIDETLPKALAANPGNETLLILLANACAPAAPIARASTAHETLRLRVSARAAVMLSSTGGALTLFNEQGTATPLQTAAGACGAGLHVGTAILEPGVYVLRAPGDTGGARTVSEESVPLRVGGSVERTGAGEASLSTGGSDSGGACQGGDGVDVRVLACPGVNATIRADRGAMVSLEGASSGRTCFSVPAGVPTQATRPAGRLVVVRAFPLGASRGAVSVSLR